MIEIKGFDFKYNDNIIFLNCDFYLPSNGLAAITGESGCGKSTLLKIINKQLKIESGCVIKKLEDNEVVYVDQYATLKSDLNIIKHFQLVSKIYQCAFDLDRMNKIIKEVGLEHLDLNILIKKLSVGERKRLAVALALFVDVKLIIIDEPTASLDFTIKKQLLELLKKIAAKRTVLITTHETDFDNLYDLKYQIIDKKIKLIFDKSINKNDEDKIVERAKRSLIKISKYMGKKERIGLTILVAVLLLVSNFTIFQQLQLYFESQNTFAITSTMSKNIIYTIFECVDRNLLPSDYTYEGYYDSGALVNLDTVSLLSNIEHVVTVHSYYQLDSTDYYSRFKDIDNTKSKVKIIKNNQPFNEFELDSSNTSTPSVVSYYNDEIINKKHLTGNYINEQAAKELNLSNSDFEDKITLSIEVGMPICSTKRNDTITYFENNVMQDTSYDYIVNDIIYDKKTVTVDIDGILSSEDYENYYNSNGIGGLIYVDSNVLDKIVASNSNKDISSRLNLWTDLNEEIIDLVPSNYAIVIDSVDNLKKVKDQILKMDSRVLTYVPYNYYSEVVATRNSDLTNSLILSAAYSLLSIAVILVILYRYNISQKDDVAFYRNVCLRNKEILKLYTINMIKAMIIFALINILIYFIRIDYVGAYYDLSKGVLFVIFFIISFLIGILIIALNYFFMKWIVYDKAN